MKRLLLAVSLCVVGFVLVPVASASAELTGVCEVKGKVTFSLGETGKLEAKLQRMMGYTFEASGGECTELPSKEKYTVGTKTKVTEGTGELSCGFSESETPGKGELWLSKGGGPQELKSMFELRFTAAGGVVLLKIYAGLLTGVAKPSATGQANFFKSKTEEAKECPKGVKELEFEATAAGTI